MGKNGFSPLLSYLEALPPWYKVSEEDIFSNLSGDGSLFQSPSATAKAFMLTGNIDSLGYLESLIQRCPNGGLFGPLFLWSLILHIFFLLVFVLKIQHWYSSTNISHG